MTNDISFWLILVNVLLTILIVLGVFSYLKNGHKNTIRMNSARKEIDMLKASVLNSEEMDKMTKEIALKRGVFDDEISLEKEIEQINREIGELRKQS